MHAMKLMMNAKWAALAIFLVGIVLTAVLHVWHLRANTSVAEERLSVLGGSVSREIGERMQSYEFGLRGAAGAVNAAGPDRMTAGAFRRYALSGDLAREFPGAHGFGVVRRVPAAEEVQFLARARGDGRPDFAIRQLSPSQGERFVIDYIEPIEPNRASVGLDIATEPSRRQAALISMHSGRATLTSPITLVQATAKERHGFLLVRPIYRAEMDLDTPAAREAATFGWAFAPLVIDNVLAGLDTYAGQIKLTLRDVTDGRTAAPFYMSAGADADAATQARHRVPMEVGGRIWELEIRPTPLFYTALGLMDPRGTVLVGLLLSCSLAALAALLIRGREREAQAVRMQAQQAAMVTASDDAIVGAALNGRITSWNPAAERLFGFDVEAAMGHGLDDLLPPDQKRDPQGHVLARVSAGEVVAPFEAQRQRSDGSLLEVSISAVPLLQNGRVVGVAKTYRDISVRKAAERQLRQSHDQLEAMVVQRTHWLETARRDLRTLIDALPSKVGYWDKGHVIRFANKAYSQSFGDEPARLPGRGRRELLGDALFERSLPLVEAALRGEPQCFEQSISAPDGLGQRHELSHYLPDVVDGEVRGFYVLVHDVTELKRSELRASAALRKSDALMAMIQQHAIVSVADRDGRIVDANDAFCRISGYTRDDLVGQTHRIVNSGEQGRQFWIHVWRTIAAGTSWRGEVCNRAKDGSLYWVDTIIWPFVGASGKVENYLSVHFDITAAKLAARALRDSQAFLERTGRLAGIGGWEFDVRSQTVRWSPETYRIHEVDPAVSPPPADALQFFAPQARPLLEQAFAAAVSQGTRYDLELPFVTAGGKHKWVRTVGEAEIVDGQVVRLLGALQDITERKRAEEEMNRTSSLLAAVLDAASEVSIIAADIGGTITLFNTGAERLLGYERSEVVGTQNVLTFHDRNELRLRAQALSAETGRSVRTGLALIDPAALSRPNEWTHRRKDGSAVRVSLSVTAMRDADGHCYGYLGVAHDISRQKEYEHSLQAAAQAAQRANEAKSQFLANMSHEIRTPLNALLGVGHLLADTPLDDDQRRLLTKSQIAGRSLLGIVNEVLDLAKIEAGELALEAALFLPHRLLHDVDVLFRAQAEAKGIAFDLAFVGDVPPCLVGDAQRVRQILVNLVGNALKFTSQGSVRVALQVLDQSASQVRLRCSVRDTGIGIDAAAQQRLFKPFSQADASTTRRYGGTGLGLSIVHQLAQAMGGEVGMTSEPGLGSEFWAVLSLAVPSATGASRVWDDGNSLEVFVVDDHPADRQALASQARRLGWRATELDCAASMMALIEARLAAGTALPEALIVDQQMPNATGLQAIEQLATRLGRESLPAILIVSSHDLEVIVRLDTQRLASSMLSKPVGASELFNAVNDGVVQRTGNVGKVLQSTRIGALQAHWLSGARVLVVDDSDINREVARRLLEREGAEVQTADNGRDALDRLRAQPDAFDVVLMDVQMPEMDGLEATRRLRAELGLKLPVVALTAGALMEEQRQAMAAGMTGFLTKPLDPQLLVRTLRGAVEAQRGAGLRVQRTADKPAVQSAWPVIEGFDATDAALRTGNDAVLFLSLLDGLIREFADLAVPALAAPEDGALRAALAARIHKLRGGLGTLGAHAVHRLATQAEQALVQPGGEAAASVAGLGEGLRGLFHAAAPVLAARTAVPGRPTRIAATDTAHRPLSQQERDEFVALLRRQELVALDRFVALAPRLRDEIGQDELQAMQAALDRLDFSGALELLGAVAH